jgi:hypothetical protein
LLADPLAISARKSEISLNEIEEQQKRIQQIFTRGCDFIIRTDHDPVTSFYEIKEIVKKNIRK